MKLKIPSFAFNTILGVLALVFCFIAVQKGDAARATMLGVLAVWFRINALEFD